MAHSPKKKAAVVADLLLGVSQRKAASKHGVSAGTVKNWAVELETTQNDAKTTQSTELPLRQGAFQVAFLECLTAITKAMTAFAEVCQDKEWVKKKPDGAAELAARTTDFADRIVAQARSQAEANGGSQIN